MSSRRPLSATRPDPAPDRALRSEGRKAWERLFAWLRKEAESADPAPVARELLAEFRRFEVALAPDEADLIANPLLWNEDERDFGLWVENGYHGIARTAATVLRRLCEGSDAPAPDLVAAMAALALATTGAAIKWAEIAGDGRRSASVTEMHRVFALAEARGVAATPVPLPNGGDERTLPVQAHYARVLLLDAFCRGNLGRQQVAIADGWLVEWCPHYRLVEGLVQGASLSLDTGGARGLRAVAPGEPMVGRSLVIEAMGEQIEEAVRWFHEGRIYPGSGAVTQFRVEEHVTVLDFLRGFLAMARRGLPQRQERDGREAVVEVHVGLAEILAKAFTGGSSEPAQPSLSLLEAGKAFGGGSRGSVTSRQYEVKHRLLRLIDESLGGVGLEGDDSGQPLEVGTLIALRSDAASPLMLGEIARRVAAPGVATRLGARVLARDMKRLTLARPGARSGAQALYLPGEDSSGRGDAVLVAQSDFDPRAVVEIHFPDREYHVRLNRIRHQGRGWVLAGLEVVEERARSAPVELKLSI